jgi:hypothetical protein
MRLTHADADADADTDDDDDACLTRCDSTLHADVVGFKSVVLASWWC